MRDVSQDQSFRKGGTLNDAGHHVRYGCPYCHEDFSSITTFDHHRTGEQGVKVGRKRRRCFTVGEMRRFGWGLDRYGRWSDQSQPNLRRNAPFTPQGRAKTAAKGGDVLRDS